MSSLFQSARATLRPAIRSEKADVVSFCKSNPRPYLLPRPADDFHQAVDRGQHFLVHHNGNLVAASGVFDYGANLPYVELSETLVLRPLKGYRLQGLFFRLRIASVVVTQGPDVQITTAIDPGNAASLANMSKQGFVPWTSAVPGAYASCPTCPNHQTALQAGRQCCCNFYVLPVDRARACVDDLLNESPHGFVDLQGKAGSLRVDCADCLVVADPDRRAMLADFVAGTTW